jgi:hypothetical protein
VVFAPSTPVGYRPYKKASQIGFTWLALSHQALVAGFPSCSHEPGLVTCRGVLNLRATHDPLLRTRISALDPTVYPTTRTSSDSPDIPEKAFEVVPPTVPTLPTLRHVLPVRHLQLFKVVHFVPFRSIDVLIMTGLHQNAIPSVTA